MFYLGRGVSLLVNSSPFWDCFSTHSSSCSLCFALPSFWACFYDEFRVSFQYSSLLHDQTISVLPFRWFHNRFLFKLFPNGLSLLFQLSPLKISSHLSGVYFYVFHSRLSSLFHIFAGEGDPSYRPASQFLLQNVLTHNSIRDLIINCICLLYTVI